MIRQLYKMVRSLFLLLLLCSVAFLGPRIYFHGKEDWARIQTGLNELTGKFTPGSNDSVAPPIIIQSAPAYTGSSDYRPIPTTSLEEILRFDWTPVKIMERWPRVSAAMPELHLQGYRVPIISGNQVDDLAGSITYYFDSEEVKKISFRGTTGDFRKLTHWLRTHYGFVQRPTNTPGVYVFEEVPNDSLAPKPNYQAKSYLWVRPAQVLVNEKPMNSFDLTLVLARP